MFHLCKQSSNFMDSGHQDNISISEFDVQFYSNYAYPVFVFNWLFFLKKKQLNATGDNDEILKWQMNRC